MLLGLDLGTKTGFCFGRGESLPTVGTLYLPSTGDDCGKFGIAARAALTALIVRVMPDLVIFEAPILSGATTIEVTRKLQGLAMVTEMVCGDLGVPCVEEHLQTVKKVLTGKGNAEKEDMVKAAQRAGLNVKTYNVQRSKAKGGGTQLASDEADAFGVWLCGIKDQTPRHYPAWTARLAGGPGQFQFAGADDRDQREPDF